MVGCLERRHRRLFVAAVMDSCQRFVQAWLDRGADEPSGSDTDSDGCILECARAVGVSDDVLELLRPAGTKRCRSPLSEQELQVGTGTAETVPCAPSASGRSMISGFVMHAGGKTCTALIIWPARACLEMFVGFESCWTGTTLPCLYFDRMSAVLIFWMCWRTYFAGVRSVGHASCGAAVAAHGWFGGGFADSRRPGDVGG